MKGVAACMQLKTLYIVHDRRKHRCSVSIMSLIRYDHLCQLQRVFYFRSNFDINKNQDNHRHSSIIIDVSSEKDLSLVNGNWNSESVPKYPQQAA